jgi:hypothetical protein
MAPIIVLFCLASGAVLIGLVAHMHRARNQREGFKELRGDWWPRFEAEFRDYAERWEAPRRAQTPRRRPASQEGPTP